MQILQANEKIKFDDYEFASICKLEESEQLIAVDEKKSEVLIFNYDFDYLKTIKEINGVQICHPERIFCQNGNLYLVQRNYHQLFQLDMKLGEIKQLIRKNGEVYDSINYPLDIFISHECIYVLILRGAFTTLQVFDLNGEFKHEVKLKKANLNFPAIENLKLIKQQLRLKVNNRIIFVFSEKKVHIFSPDGILKHTLHVNNLSNCCFKNNFLITHSHDGIVRIFMSKETQFEKYYFNQIFEHQLDSLKLKSSFFEFLNQKLIIFLKKENSLQLFSINNE